jgi:hypothetical protein
MANAERLLEMKKQVDAAKTSADQAEGALRQLKASLETEFGVKTFEEADIMLTSLEAEDKALEARENEIMAKLEKDYEWN